MKLTTFLLAGAAMLAATGAQAQTVSVGNTSPNSAGDCTPFCTPVIQTVYSASYFGSAPISINSIGLFLSSSTTSPLSFVLSTSAHGVGSLSSNFASNLSADASSFFTGAVPLTKDAQGFSIFSGTAFNYDPSKGDLLVQITPSTTDTSFSNLSAYTQNANAQRAYTFFGTNDVDSPGYVFDTKFGVGAPVASATGAVPEPASWAMMILGMGAIGFSLRSAKRRSDEKFDAKIKKITYGAIA